MSWRTNKVVVWARNIGRVTGLNRRLALWMNGRGYETRYDHKFSGTICAGDCVWDVGANIGYYTRMFSERVGESGVVFAFEPSLSNFERLCEECDSLSNAHFNPIGLGRKSGTVTFLQGSDELGATSRILEHEQSDSCSPESLVKIRSGTEIIRSGEASSPNIIKIDVEGFELEVLQGLGSELGAESLRAIGVEVHFGLLKQRGISDGPRQIEDLLMEHGFKVDWPDSSHILATRRE